MTDRRSLVPGRRRAPNDPPPEGTLAAFPFPVIYTHVLEHRVSGSLVLRGPRGDDVVVFSEGAPTRIRTAKLIAPLGEMLVRLGVIADVDLHAALQRAQTARARLGNQLVAESLVDRRVLLRALREQVLVRMRSLGALPPETSYEFHSNADVLEEGAPTNAVFCDPLAALLSFVRAWGERRWIDEVLEGALDRRAQLHPRAAIDRFELDDAERLVIAKLAGNALTVRELLQSSLAPERTIRALVYTLLVTHHLDDGSGASPLDVEPPEDAMAALRDSSLNAGIDPLRTSAAIVALGASDDHREAEALWRAGNLEAAEALAARAVERDPQNASYKALLGVVVAQQGGRANHKRGLALLDEAIAAAPGDDRALVFRGTVLRDAGKFDAALRDFRAAVAANPTNPDARLALKRAEARSDPSGLRRSRGGLPASRPPSAPSGGSSGWVVLGVLVAATVALLAVYLRMRG